MSMTHDIVHFILLKLCIVHDMHCKLTCTDTSLQDPDLVRIIIEYGGRIQLYTYTLPVSIESDIDSQLRAGDARLQDLHT